MARWVDNMGTWGFISLAYGVAATAILGSLVLLKRRLRGAVVALVSLDRNGDRGKR